jgi:hypothetical protein
MKSRRLPLASDHSCPAGVRVRYAIDRVAWIWDDAAPATKPVFLRFRLKFVSDGRPLRFQFSADQFATLRLDGRLVARGPDAAPPWMYGFSEYEVEAGAGEHQLEAFAWWMGDHAPGARMTVAPGFALAGVGDWHAVLSTGVAAWRVARVAGYAPEPDAPQGEVLETGDNGLIDAAAEHASPPDWREPVKVMAPLGENVYGSRWGIRNLEPSNLPHMPERRVAPGRIVALLDRALGADAVPEEATRHPRLAAAAEVLATGEGGAFTVAAGAAATLVWDLGDYFSGWPELVVTGGRGAEIRQIWGESFYETAKVRTKLKGHRDQVVGKYLPEGLGDRFRPDGAARRVLAPYWWRCGRYCVVTITTGAEPLTLHALAMEESGHPLEWRGRFSCDQDARVQPILKICRRTLEVGCWDTFEDSPYYEQLMYIGDTRLEMLMTYVAETSDALPRRGLQLLDSSRQVWEGLAASRFPARGRQLIASFCLKYILMVHDFGWWREDAALVRRLLPGVRVTLDRFAEWVNADGLLQGVHGWPYVDWVSTWSRGIPPTAATGGVCGLHNLIHVVALRAAAELEEAYGEPELAALQRRRAEAAAAAVRARFWSAERACLADDPEHRHWSWHAQVYGVLSGVLSREEGVVAFAQARANADFVVTSYVGRFYLFEALRLLGRGGEILGELGAWQSMLDRGAVTVWEQLEPTRSDCHAWSSHPLFHLPCSVVGVRPAAPGFARVEIVPQPGELRRVSAVVVHPRGEVAAELEFDGAGGCRGRVSLPAGVDGVLRWGGREIPLRAGEQRVG